MSYTGNVSPGGTPDTRELAHLIITKVAVDPQMSNNCYLLRCRATDEQVLIDAAAEPETMTRVLGDGRTTKVITTHQHWDHHRALADVVRSTGAVTVAGEPDADAITEQTEVKIDDRVEHGDLIEFGDVRLEVIRITGHTPGSMSFRLEGSPVLFSGDTLFPGGPGNTKFEGGDFPTIIRSIEDRLFSKLPADTIVMPGHGDDTTIGTESPHLQEWVDRGW